MKTTFTKEEIAMMDQATENIASDMRSLYNLANLEEIWVSFETEENDRTYNYKLYILKNNISIYHGGYKYACIEKKHANGKSTYPKLKDKIFQFEFLKGYEDMRKRIVHQINSGNQNKRDGMTKIAELNNKYSKEAVISVDMPETLNQSSIVVTKENGLNAGYIKIGSTTIKIFASNNVKIVSEEKTQAKTKRK